MPNWKCLFLAALSLIAAGLVITLALIYSGAYNVAADHPHYPIERWLFTTVRERAIAVRTDELAPPGNLGDPARVRAGIVHYEMQCALCHLRPGMEETDLRRSMNPMPPKLTEWSSSPAATFWAIKHGIRSTGMPAWGRVHDDVALWNIVALQLQLPSLKAAEYEAMLREARKPPVAAEGIKDDPPGEGPGGSTAGTREASTPAEESNDMREE